MIQAITPVQREIVVAASQQRAFEVFSAEMTSWWPKDHHIGAAPIDEIVIEPREGGRWYTRHVDGSETSTGFVTVWEPYDRLAVTWQIDANWRYDPRLVTNVELRFIAEAPDRTRVELEHRDLDRFGPDAERMFQMFNGPTAWNTTLAAYAEVLQPEA